MTGFSILIELSKQMIGHITELFTILMLLATVICQSITKIDKKNFSIICFQIQFSLCL